MLGKYLDRVRSAAPLIHNITNYVTANDVANLLLACGASPIMAEDENEAEEVASICAGLNLNIGTLNRQKLRAMLLAGKAARRLGHPVLLDPVGVGVSRFRMEAAAQIVQEIRPDVIRCNASEIRMLATAGAAPARGVDANLADAVTEDQLAEAARRVKQQAAHMGCILAVTGGVDLITDGKTCYCISNGRPEMGRITGTGCQLSGLTTAFLAANPGQKLEAAAAAAAVMGLAGEIGWSRMQDGDGNAAYRNRIIDAVYHMDGKRLDEGEKVTVL